MKKFLTSVIISFTFTLSACGDPSSDNKHLAGDIPPPVNIIIEGDSYDTVLGSYCWEITAGKSECIETAGPEDLLNVQDSIEIQAGEKVELEMDYLLKPNQIHLTQIKDDHEIEVELHDNQFTVPNETGIYFYSYGVWWLDEDEQNVAHGDAFYAFSLEVK